MTGDLSEPSLLAIFADEALIHLARIDASIDALSPVGTPSPPALLASALVTLHTLAGAARSVDLDDLEWLCRALEGVFNAAARSGAPFDLAQRERLRQAVAMARLLALAPGGRNQALGLIAQLDVIARQIRRVHHEQA